MVQLYVSNQAVKAKVTFLLQSGWTVIPQGKALAALESISFTFVGAMFFSIALGLTLTSVCIFLVQLYRWAPNAIFRTLCTPWLLWIIVLVAVNYLGSPLCSLWLNTYLTIIPAAIGCLIWLMSPGGRLFSNRGKERQQGTELAPYLAVGFGCLTLLSLVLLSPINAVQVRNLLAKTESGQQVIDRYYRYTMPPAEMIKSPGKKTIKTVSIQDHVNNPVLTAKLGQILRQHLYLSIPASNTTFGDKDTSPAPDLVIRIIQGQEGHEGKEGDIVFECQNHEVAVIPLPEFVAEPQPWLAKLSTQCDSLRAFKGLLLLSYFLFTPITVLFLVHPVVTYFTHNSKYYTVSLVLLESLTIVFLVIILQAMLAYGNNQISAESNDHWLARYQTIKELSGTPAGTEELKRLTQDKQLYLRGKAFTSLGLNGDDSLIPYLIDQLPRHKEWFVQWEIYRALLRLGWRPEKTTAPDP